ncbi:uncharacterized protein LOC114306184 [Camellia sinensis]|uniref:uncharacterized protein LOC114306184 n=1 Tax=Camellia sinensis TaxID=4442 RepID=UPI001036B20E|nr:uncharacterized protein LOC114306184 [Camellia sinensis]
MKPPTFYGGIEPLKAETWLLEMEKLYEVFPCTEVQKVLLATYTLKDEARRDRKVSEFQKLKQGRMSVAEHEAKFTESTMAKPTIAIMKQSKAPAAVQTDWRGKRSGFGFRRGRSYANKKQNTGSTNSSSQSSGSIPVCSECGRRHRGVCYRVSGVCFQCGQTGLVMKDCPLRSETTSRPTASLAGSASTAKTNAKANTGKEPLRQGRVFTLVPGDVQNTYTVVSACDIVIGDMVLYVDLLPLNISHFDYILGMDWLTKYCATIDRARRDVGVTCVVFTTSSDGINVETIPIACEFPDVFSNDLPGDLVDREIEFTIECRNICSRLNFDLQIESFISV